MKKIYLVGLAFALLTASCDDVLEKTSSTQLPTIDAISSVAEARMERNSHCWPIYEVGISNLSPR